MKSRIYIVLLFLLAGVLGHSQSFTPGNIVVVRVGDGSAPLSSITVPVFLEEYTPTGGFVRSISMPIIVNGANKRLTLLGSSADQGILSLSPDKRYLSLGGVDVAPLTPGSVAQQATVQKVIGLIDYSGMINTSTALNDAITGISYPSSAVTTNGSAIWTCVGGSGMRYTTVGSSISTQILSTNTNRGVCIYGGSLYIATSAGGIQRLTNGLPTTGPQTVTTLISSSIGGLSLNGFYLADINPAVAGYDVIYLAGSGGTLQKFSFNGSTWILNGKIGTTSEFYGNLTGVTNGSTVTLYITRKINTTGGGSELVILTDNTGHTLVPNSFVGTPSILTTAGTNTAFRGVAMAPIKCKEPILRIGAITPTSIQIYVSDSIDAGAPYEYEISTNSTPLGSSNSTNLNTITSTTLNPGVHYYVHVRRYCGGGDFSAWATADFTTSWPPCTAPVNIIQGLSGGKTAFTWDQVFTAIKYEYVVTANPSPISSGQFVSGQSVILSGLLSANQYYFHIRAYCGGGDTSAWSSKLFTTTCFRPSPYLITNNWQAGTAEIGWNGENRDQIFEYGILSSQAPLSGTMRFAYDTIISVKDLIPGSKYYFSVRQRCPGGTVSDWGKLEFHVSGAHVYPSPAREDITIRVYGQKTDGELLHIYDAHGRKMVTLRLAGNTATTNVNRWAPGVYFVRFGNEHTYLTKIIKQ